MEYFAAKTLLAKASLEITEKNGKKRIKVPLQNGKRVTVYAETRHSNEKCKTSALQLRYRCKWFTFLLCQVEMHLWCGWFFCRCCE